ncbi:polysaccharide biosynthesis/export family protein [Aliiroseovarius crassostreae]|uniref:Polysaccharide biosynthesis/export family protein n=1 Tax=Aliiroseovarius crassostreae TaxID=154981 RepID=A0A9Q9LW77_9RHOB|nr:polysaccharide biosynthesis/export family protein [Aliiroseovarius crassostreae]UWP90623.1 polysaccharide biosynthesis/export family protein [Aliiroseovarius crassostreae]UWP91060.1 polysaccharide biosynthesis/export family protein [Aliiroseovarius crassostreae]UWP94247.1 polysaccharide biosynthesis/export family protein [Aliiroseovarius crassostreae]UWQ00077.1 polysaccharide biosynthesis/export family protein [Aliiroseovarius crassostreae]
MGKVIARRAALLVLAGTVAACGLPRVGPNKSEIYAGSVERQGDAFIVAVNDRVTRATAVVPALGFDEKFQNASIVGSDTISAGDVLGIAIWENVEDGILTTAGAPATLDEIQVDGAGYIFIPYAGRIKASGNSPETIRRIVTEKLASQTPDPQVVVRRLAGDGSTVTMTGAVSGQGVYPIERPTRTLSAMLAKAGGVAVPPEIAKVKVSRGTQTGEIWFQDLFDNPQLDIALRGGDRILVEADTRAYTALGATGGQARVKFETKTLSAIEALAQVGGLQSAVADPTGVFVFRNEPADIANQVLGRDDLIGPQRLVYVLNLTEPNGMFMARDFVIRDGDTLYVTEAPYVQWTKLLSTITGTLSSAGSITSLGNSLQ